MIVHKNGGNPNVPNQLSFLKLGDEVSEFVMPDSPASFQAPAWSPDGAHILLTDISNNGKQEILLTGSTGAIEKTVTIGNEFYKENYSCHFSIYINCFFPPLIL